MNKYSQNKYFQNINYYDAVIVGGGIAGLTSAAFLTKAGKKVLLCEKGDTLGGLMNSFYRDGYSMEVGLRAVENSRILFPMLEQLGIQIEFVKSKVSIGMEDKVIRYIGEDGIHKYEELLCTTFPENQDEIRNIIEEIVKIMKYMNVIYGIDNPLLFDMKKEKDYLMNTVLPWLLQYQINISKAMRLQEPVNDYLRKFTSNESLIDMITQHFFKNTPTFFALSYFSLYQDYYYPKGGMRVIPDTLEEYILSHGGEIKKNEEVIKISPLEHGIMLKDGKEISYRYLIWAADSTRLYQSITMDNVPNRYKNKCNKKKVQVENAKPGESILTVYLMVESQPTEFCFLGGEHMFYTPKKEGISGLEKKYEKLLDKIKMLEFSFLSVEGLEGMKREIFEYLTDYYENTTYEVSIPAIRDPRLAPKGKTGIIISTVIDYDMISFIDRAGWYEEMKDYTKNRVIDIFTRTVYSCMKDKIEDGYVTTPRTYEDSLGIRCGAITGWSYENEVNPAVSNFKQMAKAIHTPIKDIYQAGQWTFSPSGVPVAILTGKLSADRVIKKLNRG